MDQLTVVKKIHAASILLLCSFIFLALLKVECRMIFVTSDKDQLSFLKIECMMIFVTSDKDQLSFNFRSVLGPLWYSGTFSEKIKAVGDHPDPDGCCQ